MSHELRTPLNAILGFSELLQRSEGVAQEQRDNVQIISRSGEHLLALINDVLEMSRIEAGRTVLEEVAFDLHDLLDSLADMFRLRAEAKGLQLLCEYDEDVPRYVSADEGKLRQILINLLGNAVKFTQEGGVALRARWNDGRLSCEVADTGLGIDADELTTLFEAFVQTQSGRQPHAGTGLGLAISQQFVQLMDGYEATRRIKASEEGQATTIIALTASAFEEDRSKVLDAGCDDFVRKPFRREQLFAKMSEHMDVRFDYTERPEVDDAQALTAETLAVLPAAWRRQVYEAADIADDKTLQALIAQTRAQHPALAAQLSELVRDFDFDQLMVLTDVSRSDS